MSRCPGLPLTLEVIVMPEPAACRSDAGALGRLSPDPAWEFQRFLDLLTACAGPASRGSGRRAMELENVEQSFEWLRSFVADPPGPSPVARDTVWRMPTPAPTRREFIATIAAAAGGASAVHAQTPAASRWKSPVIDGHLHLRREAAANVAHMDGCGVTKAVIWRETQRWSSYARRRRSIPGGWCGRCPPTSRQPTRRRSSPRRPRTARVGFGEMKFHVAADSPEFQRMYRSPASSACRS